MAVLALAEAGAALGRPDWVRGRGRDRGPAAGAARRGRPRAPLVARRHRRRRGRCAGGPRLPRRGAARAASGHGCGAPAGAGRRGARPDPGPLRRPGRPPGAFFDTADDAEALLHRPREITDNATPSGAAALAGALLTASVLVDDPQRYRDAAEAALRTAGGLARRFPRFAGHWLTVAEAAARGPLQVAVVGVDTERDALAGHARAIAPGGTVVVAGDAGRSRAYRCSPTGRSSTAPRRPTSAAGSSATAPSRPSRSSPQPSSSPRTPRVARSPRESARSARVVTSQGERVGSDGCRTCRLAFSRREPSRSGPRRAVAV